jgi:hypothetical protein
MNSSMARVFLPAFAIGGLLACTAFAQNQPSPSPCISASGVATLKKDPQLVRLQMDLVAQGKDLKEALAKLKERREAATKKLSELGAKADSIRFEDFHAVPAQTDQQQRMRMQRMVQARMRGEKPSAKEAAKKDPVKVSVTLKAEWPLKAGSPEDRLVATSELEDQVREADLAGQKEAEKLSAEEKEEAEEGELEAPTYYGGEEGPKPGDPVFIYVATVTDEEKAKLLADAFAKAKENATRLAQAAGAQLGALQFLNGGENAAYSDYETYAGYGGQYRQYAYQLMQRIRGAQSEEDVEAVGMQPGQVSTKMHVSASFAIK